MDGSGDMLALPERINQYRIVSRIGEGGMGVVYCAEDEQLDRWVAIKLISARFVRDPMALPRFARETQIASRLHHPHICTVFECGMFDGNPYMVMELLEGQTLREEIDGLPLPLHRIIEFGCNIADALHEAHEHGVIHRDVNSNNIFVTRSGVAKVLDFGLAKICGATPIAAAGLLWPASAVSSPGRTQGTTSNMSPEQVNGQELDRRSDIFSLGIVLFQMATGILPFLGPTPSHVMRAILYMQHIAASQLNPCIPAELDLIIARSLTKERAQRYSTAHEVRSELANLLGQRLRLSLACQIPLSRS
jgi:non-specific serine/threonine protein kinase